MDGAYGAFRFIKMWLSSVDDKLRGLQLQLKSLTGILIFSAVLS